MKREYYFFCATFALSAVVCFIACTANRVGQARRKEHNARDE